MRKASLLMLTSLVIIAAGMLAPTPVETQYVPGASTKFGIKLPDGSRFMNVTPPTYDIGDKFNITVEIQSVTEMTGYGVTIMWNATFVNTTGNKWMSPFFLGEMIGGRWSAASVGYLGNDLRTQPGKELLPPLVGAMVGYGQTALKATNNLTGSYDICTIEFQVNAYGPSWFYVWKDPAKGNVGHYEGIFPAVTPPITYSGWMSPPLPGVKRDYDVVWAPGYTDVANAVLYVNPPTAIPIIESCNSTGANKDLFNLSDTVYVNGSGYSPSTTFDIYIVNDVTSWSDGMTIPTRVPGTNNTVSSNSAGDIPPTAVWSPDLTLGEYDIVVDVNNNSKYDVGIDALDDMDIEETAGFSVIPEFPSLIILPLFMMATLLAVIVYRRKHSMRARIDVK